MKSKNHNITYVYTNIIDHTDNVEDLRKRKSFWQHELETFQRNGLNERDVALF